MAQRPGNARRAGDVRDAATTQSILAGLRPVGTDRPDGVPLYAAVRDAVLAAIEDGTLGPGGRIPSTADLARRLDVSLVTAHRALGELVSAGVLRRAQGRGTFVDERYRQRLDTAAHTRVGLVFHDEASLADHYHGHLAQGVRRASHDLHVDVVLLRFGEDVRGECAGFLYVNPLPGDLTGGAGTANRRRPVVVVGAESDVAGVASVDTDNRGLAAEAVRRLAAAGHRRIAFVGDCDGPSNSRDRCAGFNRARAAAGLDEVEPVHVGGWRLGEAGRAQLVRRLREPDRPTAVLAVGYVFALDVYLAAAEAGLSIPRDLSVVGVDDPPSAELLTPPLTTFRQPLEDLGYKALQLLVAHINGEPAATQQTLAAEWIDRSSIAPPPD